MQFINKAYLLIGGNVGNMFHHLDGAVRLLKTHCGEIYKESGIYKTAPWGNKEQAPFLNQAIELHTAYTAEQLMPKLLDIEERMGRIRKEKYGPRIIDIDILLFNEDVIEQPGVTIPHPEMQNRLFALIPLAEIAGELYHPVYKKTIHELITLCKDESAVVKV
jgi:2-amino-4-hydroxy-6-hydroxymethyldihydropteridine diphosphokinase